VCGVFTKERLVTFTNNFGCVHGLLEQQEGRSGSVLIVAPELDIGTARTVVVTEVLRYFRTTIGEQPNTILFHQNATCDRSLVIFGQSQTQSDPKIWHKSHEVNHGKE
jgi:hypothetical protein